MTLAVENGDLTAKIANPAVSARFLANIVMLQCQNLSWTDIINALRADIPFIPGSQVCEIPYFKHS